MKNTFSRTGKQPKHATCSVLLWGNITHSTFRVHFDISPAATSSKNMCIPGLKYVWATHIRSLQAEGLYITEHINWVLTVVQDLCLVFQSVEIFWLWQLKGQIQIILIPINPFSDPSCPIWKRLQFLHVFFFFFFFFFYLLGSVINSNRKLFYWENTLQDPCWVLPRANYEILCIQANLSSMNFIRHTLQTQHIDQT